MIEHFGKRFEDTTLRPYEFTKRLLANYNDEWVILGGCGMPKSIWRKRAHFLYSWRLDKRVYVAEGKYHVLEVIIYLIRRK